MPQRRLRLDLDPVDLLAQSPTLDLRKVKTMSARQFGRDLGPEQYVADFLRLLYP